MNEKQKRKLTIKKFAEYEKQICKRMGFNKGVWRGYRDDILKYCEPYDPEVSYAGRGDSRSFHLTEILVPEVFDNWIYYKHDKMYELIDLAADGNAPLFYEFIKDTADDMMYEEMEIANEIENGKNDNTILPEIYHFFVKWFG
jgi:hypothetical protein